jgi:hypothetical protein
LSLHIPLPLRLPYSIMALSPAVAHPTMWAPFVVVGEGL